MIDLVEAPAHPLPGGAAEASAAPAACEAVGAGSVAGGTANLPVDPLPSGSVVYATDPLLRPPARFLRAAKEDADRAVDLLALGGGASNGDLALQCLESARAELNEAPAISGAEDAGCGPAGTVEDDHGQASESGAAISSASSPAASSQEAAIDRLNAKHERPPFKVCGCGARFSSTSWQYLALRGIQSGELELRDCSYCRSTLAVPLPTRDCPDCGDPLGFTATGSCDCGAVVSHAGCRSRHGCDGDDGRVMGPGYEP